MGTEKYISEVKNITSSQEMVYNYLADLSNFEKLFDPEKVEELKRQHPDAPDIRLDNFRATADECSFTISPVGTVGVHIIEREPFKTIKLSGSKSMPFQFNCWIQLLPSGVDNSKIKITLHAELNPMIKMLVDKYLKEGVDRIADALTRIDYR